MMSMLVLVIFSSMTARVIFSPIMPALQNELGFGLTLAGSLFLLMNVSYGIVLLLAGFLSSRIGHGLSIVVSLSAVATGIGIAAAASAVWMLIAGILLMGAGAGLYPSSGLVMINTKIDEEHRSTAFSFHEIGPNLALLAAPIIVVLLRPHLGWRGVLFAVGGLALTAALVFWRWGAANSGKGAVPNLSTVGTILRLRTALLAMMVLSAALSGVQGVYAILPAYLVSTHGLAEDFVNVLVSFSRVAGIVLLVTAGPLINRIGRRQTIAGVLLVSAVLTALLGLTSGTMLAVVVVAQPALLSVLFPAALATIGTIGEAQYQNVTYSLVITIAVGLGAGLAPTVLGAFGDLGVGWIGFVAVGIYMVTAVFFMWRTPEFGRHPAAGGR
jgi:MFS family permease